MNVRVTDERGYAYVVDRDHLAPAPYEKHIVVIAFPTIKVTREIGDYIDLDLDRNNVSLNNTEARDLITALQEAIDHG